MSDYESDDLPDMSAIGPAVHAAPVDNADQSTDDEEDPRDKTGRDLGEWLTRGLKSSAREILCPCGVFCGTRHSGQRIACPGSQGCSLRDG